MTDQSPDNPSLAERVCRYCDDEMVADERRVFAEQVDDDPGLQALVRDEQALRTWVERSMGVGPAAPVDLEKRVRDALGATDPASPVEPDIVGRSWLAGPRRVNGLAVAACLVIVVGAVLFGIYGPTLDDVRQRSGSDLVADTVQYVMDEHHRCAARPAERDAKVQWADSAVAELALRDRLPAPVQIVDLQSLGYTFRGVGDGGLPSAPRSVHMVYVQQAPALDGCPEALVSLFVVPDSGQLDRILDPPLRLNTWSVIEQGDRPHGRVAVLSRDGLLYFLVCCNQRDMEPVAATIGR